MDITTAIEALGDLLDVTEDRYPSGVRILHMNQSLVEVGREFETAMNEGVGWFEITKGQTRKSLDSLSDESGAKLAPSVIEAAWYSQDYTATAGISYSVNSDWDELPIYPNYKALLNSPSVDASTTGDVIGIALHGDQIYLANEQTVDTLVRCTFRGYAQYIGAGENRWLRDAPWPIIYHCAQLACVWLEDEARLPVYKRLYDKAIEVVNLEDSMRNNAPMETTEV